MIKISSPREMDSAGENNEEDYYACTDFAERVGNLANEPMLFGALSHVIHCVSSPDCTVAATAKKGLDDFVNGLVDASALACIDELLAILAGASSSEARTVCTDTLSKLIATAGLKSACVLPDVILACTRPLPLSERTIDSRQRLKAVIADIVTKGGCSPNYVNLLTSYFDPRQCQNINLSMADELLPSTGLEMAIAWPGLLRGLEGPHPLPYLLLCSRIAKSGLCTISQRLGYALRQAKRNAQCQQSRALCEDLLRMYSDVQPMQLPVELPKEVPRIVSEHCHRLAKRGGPSDDLRSLLFDYMGS